MKTLNATTFRQAQDYVLNHARPVDRALWNHWFNQGPASAVADALAPYQNTDGGFGHAIEPDFRLPDSTATASTVAFQYLTAASVPANDPRVQRGIDYFLSTFNHETRSWLPVVATIADHPRANWWNAYPPITYAPDAQGWGNPSAEAIGWLNHYADLVDAGFLDDRIADAIAWIEHTPKFEPHELLCCQRFASTLTPDQAAPMHDRLNTAALDAADTDPAKWPEYAAQPVWFATSPDTPLANAFGQALQDNLDFVVDQQQDDGSWQPTWTWGRYENHWPQAAREWSGHLTVHRVKLLDAFGRVTRPQP
ncbi:MAG: hypothetical protein AAF750_16755 [Planctomycetota bacterium]